MSAHDAKPRLDIPAPMRERMAYAKLAGDTPRVLVLESGYWLDAACMHACERLGWTWRQAEVSLVGVMSRERVAGLLQALLEFRPDFVLSINLSGMDQAGLFAGLFEDLCVPLVTWFVDDPRTILMGRRCYASSWSLALSWDRGYLPYLAACGFEAPCYLPLAADTTVFNAPPDPNPSYPPAFVGNSMAGYAEEEWAWIRERPALAEAMDRAFAEGHVTRERFGEGLDRVLPPAYVAALDAEERRHAELVFFIEGTRRLRGAMAQHAVKAGAVVHGDAGWRESIAEHRDFVQYSEALPAFYRDCVVNLNTTSIQMAAAVNQRVFDCPAAGGFLLTDAQAGLAELFDPEGEVATYESHDELSDKIWFYRDHPGAGRAIAEAARKRVLGEHTYEHRLREIVRLLTERYGSG